jgi:response regulator RpfG family c-di-GMP phosphodiesterase
MAQNRVDVRLSICRQSPYHFCPRFASFLTPVSHAMKTSPARLLIVEDEPLSADMLRRRLAGRGYEVLVAHDTKACIDTLQVSPVDLLLLDISLGGASGIDLLKALRRTWSHDALPVIGVSALVDSDDVIAALEAGANDYVVKPVNFPVLAARIEVCLRIKRQVEQLVKAERERAAVDAVAKSAASLGKPILEVVNSLENAMQNDASNDPVMAEHLQDIYHWVEEAVDVLDRVRKLRGDSPH